MSSSRFAPLSTSSARRRAARAIPARWPSGRGRLRSRAQRPLPSMMTATWRGTTPLPRICASRSSAMLDLHDLRFLRLDRLVHELEALVVQLLDVLLGVLLLVLR